jgi:hypothetical protein
MTRKRRAAECHDAVDRALAAGASPAAIRSAIEELVKNAGAPPKRGRPRRGHLWADPNRDDIIRLAALVAQKLARPYEAARWIARDVFAGIHRRPGSFEKRFVSKFRAYFPEGLPPDHPLNAILIFRVLGPGAPRIDDGLVYDFEQLKARASAIDK